MTLSNANRVKILICALLATGVTALYGQTISRGVTVPPAAAQPVPASRVLASARAPAAGCVVRPAASFC